MTYLLVIKISVSDFMILLQTVVGFVLLNFKYMINYLGLISTNIIDANFVASDSQGGITFILHTYITNLGGIHYVTLFSA